MAHIAGTDRTQAVLLPEVLDDYVTADNPVRFLDAFVAQLDLGALGFQRAEPAETGRRATIRETCCGSISTATCTGFGQAAGWSRRRTATANEARGLFTKDDFVYDPAADAYRCPAGETLTYRTTTLELGRLIKNYQTSVCGRCALKPRCTRNRDGRKITRWVDEHLLEAMEHRLARDRALFAQRKALSEHPFGTMKRAMDQGYFLLKGLRKVRGEFSLTVLAYNLKRVLNLVGVARLLEALA